MTDPVTKKQIVKITGEITLEGTVFENAGALTAIGGSVNAAQDAIRGASPLTKDFVLNTDVEDVKPPRKPRTPVPASPPAPPPAPAAGNGNKS